MIEVIVIEPNGSNRVFGVDSGSGIVLEGVPVKDGIGEFVVDGVRAEYSANTQFGSVLLTPVLQEAHEVQDEVL